MFTHHCTTCDRRQLIFASQVLGLANTDRGIDVCFVCWCGSEQSLTTGADADPAHGTVAA